MGELSAVSSSCTKYLLFRANMGCMDILRDQLCSNNDGVCTSKYLPLHCAISFRPIQLSWNYNYISAGDALGVDLCATPELVATDPAMAWGTGKLSYMGCLLVA